MRLDSLELGDSREIAESIPDGSIDLVLTDPPYDKRSLALYKWLAKESARVLKPGGFVLTYCGQSYLNQIHAYFSSYLEYYWQFVSLEAGCNLAVHHRKIHTGYKPILCYSKGPSKLSRYARDVVKSTRKAKAFHIWGQNEMVAAYLLEYFTQAGDTVWEPFSGGGTIPYVCMQLGRHFYASEISEKHHAIAMKRLEVIQKPLMVC